MAVFTKFKEFLTEAKKGVSYSDEHAHAKIWNHMVGKGIAHDKEAMMKELDTAKKDKKHPLHFDNAEHEGFVGGTKTKDAKDSYHKELETAVHTVHALATHKDFKKAVKEKHIAKVMGGARGTLSETWKKHGAKDSGAVSKADVSIYDPKKKDHAGIRLSMKKGGGSQLMSASPEENKAVHDHATSEMLNNHPKYKNLTQKKKDAIHKDVMDRMDKVAHHIKAMKTASREEFEHHKNEAQKHLNAVHDAHPDLNAYVRKEATTGEGKFGKGSAHAAAYLVTSAHGGNGAKVQHVDEIDHSSPKRPRAALPKGTGREGNIKLDT